jgi:hypothetical protein
MAASASSVSRVLTAGGMTKARWSPSSRVKGWGNWHEGMLAENVTTYETERTSGWVGRGANRYWSDEKVVGRNVPTGEVKVTWVAGSWSRGDNRATEAEKLAEAERVLTAKGYKVERKTDRASFDRPYLSVTKD